MRRGTFITFWLAVSAVTAFADAGVISQWVMPTRPGHNWELRPHERTRPVVVGDVLYFANLDGKVFAVHRTDGYVLWEKKLPGAVDGALSYGRSKVFVGDNQGNLVALNARDGSEAWRFKAQAEWLSPPLVVRDKIFAATSSDEIYALSDAGGKELWHYAHRGDEKMTIRGTSSPVHFAGEIFHGFSDGFVASLTAADGKVRWTKKLRSRDRFYDVDSTPYVDETRIIAGTFDGKVYSLDRNNGDIQWVFPAGSYGGFHVEDDRVYFSGLDGNIYALDKGTGAAIWKRGFGRGIGLTPAKAGDFLVVTTSGDPVYLLDPKSGEPVWTGSLGTGTLAAATGVAEGWFYCLSNYGNLYSFEVRKDFTKRKGPETITPPSAIYHLAKASDNPDAT